MGNLVSPIRSRVYVQNAEEKITLMAKYQLNLHALTAGQDTQSGPADVTDAGGSMIEGKWKVKSDSRYVIVYYDDELVLSGDRASGSYRSPLVVEESGNLGDIMTKVEGQIDANCPGNIMNEIYYLSEVNDVNQCDGCLEGLPLQGGEHYKNGKIFMGCTRHLYGKLHYVVNPKTGEYMAVYGETFKDGWQNNYPHKGDNPDMLIAYPIYDDYHANGIPYSFSLAPAGGYFTLLVDRDRFTKEDIKKARAQIKQEKDVLNIRDIIIRRIR
ncbi:MAG: hypothetical protein SVK08_00230 [Halobacteriota archaeon]|nr:hypothetical protein [Halobacteriota archaeon]